MDPLINEEGGTTSSGGGDLPFERHNMQGTAPSACGKERFKEKNRLAQKRFRAKQKSLMDSMRAKIADLEEKVCLKTDTIVTTSAYECRPSSHHTRGVWGVSVLAPNGLWAGSANTPPGLYVAAMVYKVAFTNA